MNGAAAWNASPTVRSFNGGIFVGDTVTFVDFGADNTTDADDSCTLGGYFLPVSDIVP